MDLPSFEKNKPFFFWNSYLRTMMIDQLLGIIVKDYSKSKDIFAFMRNCILCMTCLIASFSFLVGQDLDRQRTAILIERNGIGMGYSIMLDRMLSNPSCGTWSLHTGFGGFDYNLTDQEGAVLDHRLIAIPIGASYLVGKNNTFFEAGLGLNLLFSDFEGIADNDFVENAGFNTAVFGNLGYRYQSLKLGGIFRLSWNPVINKGGFSLGRFGIGLGLSIN